MTSNIGAQHIQKMEKLGFSSADDDKNQYEDTKGKVLDNLNDFFRPEFLNRLDEIIMFNILSPAAIKKIVKMQINIVPVYPRMEMRRKKP